MYCFYFDKTKKGIHGVCICLSDLQQSKKEKICQGETKRILLKLIFTIERYSSLRQGPQKKMTSKVFIEPSPNVVIPIETDQSFPYHTQLTEDEIEKKATQTIYAKLKQVCFLFIPQMIRNLL